MSLLMPWGRALLLGSFGVSLVRVSKGDSDLTEALETLVVGTLGLALYPSAYQTIQGLSQELAGAIKSAGGEADLRAFILESLKKAATATPLSGGPTSMNIPSITEQVLRTGVWGVMSLITDFFFILSTFLIETAQSVLSKLLLFLFPLGFGLFPVFPKLAFAQCIFAIELALWLPVLYVIERLTCDAAREYVVKDGSWGLYLVSVELIAIILMLGVPMTTHRLLAAALSGDFGTHGGLIGHIRTAASYGRSSAKSSGRGGAA